MDEDLVQRDIGRMTAEISQSKQDIQALRSDLHEIKNTIVEIKNIMAQTKGGWKVLVIMGSIIATVSGLLVAAGLKVF